MSAALQGFRVVQPGILSLLQDAGRFGHHNIGLTTGGPLDRFSFIWANRLCGNTDECCVIESSMGGLVLHATIETQIALTGGDAALSINQQSAASWQTHTIKAGDEVSLGFAQQNPRHYLAVKGGFQVDPMFGSAATVVREKMGGLVGTGLQANDQLACSAFRPDALDHCYLDPMHQPNHDNDIVLRVVLGYQQKAFSALQQRRFFSHEFTVDDRCDRMGFRLTGPDIQADVSGILSEGICFGAIQIPPDGQPIVLLNDRQTIGGYPKIGAVLSLDIPKLTQRLPGSTVRFQAISMDEAQHQLHLAHYRDQHTMLTPITSA